MTVAAAVPRSGFVWDVGYDPVTSDSRAIQHSLAQERNYLRGSASDWLPVVYATLRAIQSDCTAPNWDGTGALPVTTETIELAGEIASALYKMLPPSVPVPDIIPEADGEICMSWYTDARQLFSLSIGAHGIINFAGQFGKTGGRHGWQSIDTTTRDGLEKSLQEVAQFIRRLY